MKQKQPARVGRRLAAIVAADVAGYSRLMGLDEVGAARTLREHRKVMLRLFGLSLTLFAFVILPSLCTSSALADGKLLGVWKLNGFVVESVETKLRRYPFGQNPKGYVIITADRLITVLTGEGRKPPTTDDDWASSFKTMIAYTGQYRIEDDRLITKVDAAWNEG
jgi:Lipocalin-like domain